MHTFYFGNDSKVSSPKIRNRKRRRRLKRIIIPFHLNEFLSFSTVILKEWSRIRSVKWEKKSYEHGRWSGRHSCTHHTFLTLLKLVIRVCITKVTRSTKWQWIPLNRRVCSLPANQLTLRFYFVSLRDANIVISFWWKNMHSMAVQALQWTKKKGCEINTERWLVNLWYYLITQCMHCLNDPHFYGELVLEIVKIAAKHRRNIEKKDTIKNSHAICAVNAEQYV